MPGARRLERGLADHPGEVRPRQADVRTARSQIDSLIERQPAGVQGEDRAAAGGVRWLDADVPVETAGKQHGGVEQVPLGGRTDDHDPVLRGEAVDRHKQMVERGRAFHAGVLGGSWVGRRRRRPQR